MINEKWYLCIILYYSIILLQFDADLGGSCSIPPLRDPDSSLVQCWCTAFRNSTPSCEGMDFFLMGWVFPRAKFIAVCWFKYVQMDGYSWILELCSGDPRGQKWRFLTPSGDISVIVTFIHGRVPRAYTPACWSSTIEIVHSPPG